MADDIQGHEMQGTSTVQLALHLTTLSVIGCRAWINFDTLYIPTPVYILHFSHALIYIYIYTYSVCLRLSVQRSRRTSVRIMTLYIAYNLQTIIYTILSVYLSHYILSIFYALYIYSIHYIYTHTLFVYTLYIYSCLLSRQALASDGQLRQGVYCIYDVYICVSVYMCMHILLFFPTAVYLSYFPLIL